MYNSIENIIADIDAAEAAEAPKKARRDKQALRKSQRRVRRDGRRSARAAKRGSKFAVRILSDLGVGNHVKIERANAPVVRSNGSAVVNLAGTIGDIPFTMSVQCRNYEWSVERILVGVDRLGATNRSSLRRALESAELLDQLDNADSNRVIVI